MTLKRLPKILDEANAGARNTHQNIATARRPMPNLRNDVPIFHPMPRLDSVVCNGPNPKVFHQCQPITYLVSRYPSAALKALAMNIFAPRRACRARV